MAQNIGYTVGVVRKAERGDPVSEAVAMDICHSVWEEYAGATGQAKISENDVRKRLLLDAEEQSPIDVIMENYFFKVEGGLDYLAYYLLDDLMGEKPNPTAEYFRKDQALKRARKLKVEGKLASRKWIALAVSIHQLVEKLNEQQLKDPVLGPCEKALFDTSVGGVYYQRLSHREVVVALTLHQPIVCSGEAMAQFTEIGDKISALNGRKRFA